MFDLVKTGKVGTLATAYEDGTFTSLVPYALDQKGRPVILISEIAIHTGNLEKNASCSMMVNKANDKDIFESQRLTYIGKMKPVPDKEVEVAKKVYLQKFPDAENLFELEDFHLYRMEIKKVYYIGGFASAEWIELKDYEDGFKEETPEETK